MKKWSHVSYQVCPKCVGRKVIPMCISICGKMSIFDDLLYKCPQCNGTGKIPTDPTTLKDWEEQFKMQYELQWTDPVEFKTIKNNSIDK